jgi:hypothetical protein
VDGNIEMESGSGGRLAAPIWMRFVKAAYGARNPGKLEAVGPVSVASSNAGLAPEEGPSRVPKSDKPALPVAI